MNRKKRGLALLLCICMLFTLMPMAAFADGTSNADVVYGSYDSKGDWSETTGMTAATSEKTYKNDTTGASVKYSKTAESKVNDLYDITLKIESETNPGAAATVLVIDTSSSMDYCSECGSSSHSNSCKYHKDGLWADNSVASNLTRMYAAKEAAISFLDSFKGTQAGSGRYVSVVRFASESSVACDWQDISTDAGYEAVVAAINGLNADGGTNTYAGLHSAELQFNKPALSGVNVKNTVMLTDGIPTLGKDGAGLGSTSYGTTSKDAIDAATELKKVSDLYTICFAASKDIVRLGGLGILVEKEDIECGVYLRDYIASSETGKTYAYNADTVADLNTAFNTIVNSIKSGLSSGFTVTDPMGGMVTLQNTTLTDCTIANDTITWNPTAPTDTKVDEKTGKTTYIFELTYTVKLNTEADGFESNKYYPTNGNTTLSFVDGNDTKTLQFNVPGVKGVKPTYTVTYQYDDTAPDGAALPTQSTVQVQKDDEHTVATPTAVPGWTFNGWKTSDVTDSEMTYVGGGKFNMPNNNVTLVGSWTENPTYGVTYQWADSSNVPSTVTLPNDNTKYETGNTVTVAAAPSATGWTFNGWTTTSSGVTVGTDGKFTMPGNDVEFVGTWTQNQYKVTYQYTSTNNPSDESAQLPGEITGKHYGDEIDVTVPSADGWTFSGWTSDQVTVGTNGKFNMPASDVTLTGSWTKRSDLSYTVECYWIGEPDTKIDGSGPVNSQVFGTTVTVDETSAPTIAGYTLIPYSAKNADGTDIQNPKVTIGTGNNVIKLYYYKNVTLTANSETGYVYDGTAKSVAGFTGAPDDADFSAITVSRTETNADTYDVNFADGTVGTVDGNGKYIVTAANKGTLKIAPAHKVTYKYIYSDGSAVPSTVLAAPVDDTYHKDGVEFNLAIDGSINGYTFSGWFVNGTGAAVDKLTLDGANVELVGKFTPQTGLSYTVNYYWNGTTTPVATSKTVDRQTYGAVITNETPKAINGYTALENQPCNLTIGTDSSKNVINFYYYKNVKLFAFSGGSDVYYDGTQKTVTGFAANVIPDNTDVNLANVGTLFPQISAGVSGTNAATYTSKFSLSNNDGKNEVEPAELVGQTDINEQYYVVEAAEGTLTINRRPLTITGDGYATAQPYTGTAYTKTTYTYNTPTTEEPDAGLITGHKITGLTYLLIGTDASSTPYVGAFTGTIKIMAGTEDVTANYRVDYAVGELTITPSTETIKVTITGKNDIKTYTGDEQRVEGYTWKVAGADKDQISVTLNNGCKAVAKGTAVGTYPMNLNENMFSVTSQNYSNIEIAIEDGWLKIEAKPYTPPVDPGIYTKITVKITGNSASEVYDGTEKSVEGYTVEISDPRYTEKDFKFTGTAEAKGTFVGEYPMGLEADQFVNINRRFKNVEFIIVEDGVLTITARPITITAGSAEGWVTDCPITCDEWTSTPPAPGDTVVSVKITGVQNGPGSSPNVPSDAVIKNEAGKDVTDNYDITYVNGLLVAKDLLEKEDHFNYVIGYPDGSVQPNGNITRAEVATIFYRLLTDEARAKYTTTDNSFSDIKAGEWYTKAIATLENANIIGGYPDGTFKPNAPITRAEMATIIAKFANLDENGKSFNDIKGHWAQSYVELAAGNGWINGYEDGTFRPDKNITRAETFAMINRVLDRQVESVDDLLPTSQMNMWSDNLDPTQWYYKDVQEATNYHKCDRVNESQYETWTEKVPDIDWAKIQY